MIGLFRFAAITVFFICLVCVVDDEKNGKATIGKIAAGATAGMLFLLSYNIK